MSYEVQRSVGRAVLGKKPGGVSALLRKAILMNMAIRANDDGSGIFASKLKIAMWLEVEERSVRRGIKTLEDDGLLTDLGDHVNPSGAITRHYQINLDTLEKLPRTEEVFKEKRTAERSRKRQGADNTSAPKSPKRADGSSAQGADNKSNLADGSSAKINPIGSLPSKEGREPVKADAKASDDVQGFQLTPNARDPGAPKRERGERAPKVGEKERAREFWKSLCDSGAIDNDTIRLSRCKPKAIDSALPPLLQAYGWDDVMEGAIWHYRKEGKFASGLQDICNDGRLAAIIDDLKRKRAQSPVGKAVNGAPCDMDTARRRVKRRQWPESYGDPEHPIYVEARKLNEAEERVR